MRFGILLGLLFLSAQAFTVTDTKVDYLKASALPGDGVYSLLRRYHLDGFPCNHEEFYRLNNLKKGASLTAEKEYLLPIKIYKYNGTSIRSTIGNNDWDTAVRIQKFNEEMLSIKMKDKSYQDSKVLWVPFHELNCPESAVEIPAPADPVKSPLEDAVEKEDKPRHYPIFGEKYAFTPQLSDKLKGKVFYVVSGHGGPDPGAMGKRSSATLCEDEYAYDVALRLVKNLIAEGAVAYMITRDNNDGIRDEQYLNCDNDEVVWGDLPMPLNQRARLFQRSDAINELYEKHKKQGVTEQTVIVIHVDSRSKGAQTDVFFYYHPDSSTGKELATKIHKVFVGKYAKYRRSGEYQGTVGARDLHMTRECKPTTVYIELGNIRNKFDQMRIVLESNRQALANWLLEGIQ